MHAQNQSVQNSTSLSANKLFVEMAAGTGLKQHDVTPVSYSLNIGYNISPKFYVFARMEGLYGLYQKNDIRVYNKSYNLGGGLGYNIWTDNSECKLGKSAFDIRTSITSSVGNADWKNTTYDAGIFFYLKNGKDFSPIIGLGFRHVTSRTAGLRDYNCIYASVGLKF